MITYTCIYLVGFFATCGYCFAMYESGKEDYTPWYAVFWPLVLLYLLFIITVFIIAFPAYYITKKFINK